MTSSDQTLAFQQRPDEVKSSLESNKSHDKEKRAEGANGDSGQVALWWEKGGRKAGTGGNQRIKAAKKSEERTDDSSGPVLVKWKDVAS